MSRAAVYRKPTPAGAGDLELMRLIDEQYLRTPFYGARKMAVVLTRSGHRVGRKRVTRLMREAGLRGVSRRRWVKTTRRALGARPAPDLVQRHFQADAPNRLWVADATYIPTAAGFFYLAVVLDVFSRRIVGWAMGSYL